MEPENQNPAQQPVNQNQPVDTNIQQPVTDTPVQTPTVPASPQKPKKKWLMPGIIGLLIVALGITGYFTYQYFKPQKEAIGPAPGDPIPTITTAPTPDPTAGWETYSGNGYSFKYPKGLKSDTEAAGQGVESIRVQFIGPKQVASGRTETSLFDGYSFVVTKISSNTTKTAQQQAQEERINSEENCGFDQSTISPATQTQIAGINATQYSVTECFGDYTNSYLENNNNIYRITQLYTGEEPEKQDYKTITNQILSTFKFANQNDNLVTEWETYNNQEHQISISFKYPKNWAKNEPTSEHDTAIVYIYSDETHTTPDGIVYPSPYYLWVNVVDKLPDLEFTRVVVGQYTTYRTSDTPATLGALSYYFTKNDERYVAISISPYDEELSTKPDRYLSIFDQILSSFEFTD